VHDAGRDLERLAGEADAGEGLERRALVAPGIVEIGPRLVSEQHCFGIERIDQARSDPHLRPRALRIVHHNHSATVHRFRKRPARRAAVYLAPTVSRWDIGSLTQ